ncbi:DinB family protein [Streptococcus macacae]|uniref:DinB-like domain-containing protein n=1 Tax=Streptococcus macacae NCTC 11558 TaxID=764298 RepID=G5JYH9_9STRE|nr:DinB family protein [Streptococcus macacae]EHJ51801.1 hypothetical protein STRMA_0240 [Streptococcus macacae NCTC 11558]SUN78092.1 Protein of uncharacterised function (DUF664) [Streptococcus macacae NCTC 11558]
MTYLEMLIDSLNRARERFLRMLDGVTVEEANAFPQADKAPQIKSLTWLTWHTARELDLQIAALAETESVWKRQDFALRFPFKLADQEDGWNHTLEQAQKIVTKDLDSLTDYLNAASSFVIDYLHSLNEANLDEIVDDSWTPAVTRGVRLVSIIDDAAMHSGQAVYARRLLGLKD